MNEEEELLEDITEMNTQEPPNKIEEKTEDTSKEKSEDIQKTSENQEKKEGKVTLIEEQDQMIEDAMKEVQNYAKDQIQSEDPDTRNNLEKKEHQRIQGKYKEEEKQTKKGTRKGERNIAYMED